MRWALGLAAGLGLALAASGALACHATYRCPPAQAYDGPDGPPPPERYDSGAVDDARDGPPEPAPPPPPLTLGERYTLDTVWRDDRGGLYMHGYRAAPCRCRAADAISYERSEVSVSDGFFADGGGVGPIPFDGYYDNGGYVIVGSGAHAHASASARASVSVRFRGGFRGGCCHGGHKGGGKRH